MTQDKPPVKDRFLAWIDAHPRVGWYIALITTANFALQILDITLR